MRTARIRGVVDLQLRQPGVIRRVLVYGARANNPDLVMLFMRIKIHMIKHLHNSRFENKSVNTQAKVAGVKKLRVWIVSPSH
jgi:hypothetical protein